MPGHFLNIPIAYKLGTRLAGHIPVSFSYFLAHGIADISHFIYKSAAGNVEQNLRLALPNLSGRELSRLTKRLFRNYGEYLVDYSRFTNMDKNAILEKIVSYSGKQNLDDALQMNKGLIILTAHLGNWELGGIFFGRYGMKINVITIQDINSRIDNTRKSYRAKHDVATITVGDSPFSTVELMRALGDNEAVAILIDRYRGDADGLQASFFGKTTMFPKGPFILSRLTGAPIVAAFVVREGRGYKGIIDRPITVTSRRDEQAALGEVVKTLEKYIAMYPDQWYNFTPI